FVNQSRKLCKVLLWGGTGLCIFQKRLEKARSPSYGVTTDKWYDSPRASSRCSSRAARHRARARCRGASSDRARAARADPAADREASPQVRDAVVLHGEQERAARDARAHRGLDQAGRSARGEGEAAQPTEGAQEEARARWPDAAAKPAARAGSFRARH